MNKNILATIISIGAIGLVKKKNGNQNQNQSLLSKLNSLKPLFVKAAQDQYDSWNQDESGYDHEVGYGGICHLIADDITEIIYDHIPNVLSSTISSNFEQHVYAAVASRIDDEWECYTVDIHHSFYETGGGFHWTKIPEIEFDESMVSIQSNDPENLFDEESIEWYIGECNE